MFTDFQRPLPVAHDRPRRRRVAPLGHQPSLGQWHNPPRDFHHGGHRAAAGPALAGRPNRIIYDEMPEGLLTLTDAAARYGVRRNTLEVALFRGNIPRAGRIKGHG